MRICWLVSLLACSAVVAQPSDDAVTKELKHFQGKWQATFAQNFDGKVQTDVEVQLTTMEVEGEKFTIKTGSITVQGAFKIDPTQKIKTIDVTLGESKETVLRGIYEIKGDTRRSCFAMPGKDRPTAFSKDKGFLSLDWRLDK